MPAYSKLRHPLNFDIQAFYYTGKKCYELKRCISNNTVSRAKNVTIQDEKIKKTKNLEKI